MRKWSKRGQTDPIFWEWIFEASCCRNGQNWPKSLSLPSWWRFRPCRSCFAHKFWAPGTWRSIYQKLYSRKRKKQSPSFKNLKAKPEKYIFIKLFFIKYYIFLNICKHQKPLLSSIKIEAFNHSKHTRSSQSFPKTSSSQSGAWQISLSAGFSCSAHIPSRLHTT